MKRTDVHCPSQIIPADYQFVAFEQIKIESFGMCEYALQQRELIRIHMEKTGGTYSNHEHGGNCMVCGNVMATYTILFYHAKSNTYVRTGQDCAAKLELSYGDFNKFTAACRNHELAKAGKKKAAATLAAAGLSKAWDIYTAAYESLPINPYTVVAPREQQDFNGNTYMTEGFAGTPYSEEITVRDIVGKLVKYGSISDKAMSFLGSLLARIDKRAAVLAERAAERAAAKDAPKGRVTVTGTVLKVETRDSQWGFTTKMTVKSSEGFIVWVSVPSGLTAERDATVTFTATLEPSDNDPKFCFGKRPTLARAAGVCGLACG